MSKGVDLYRIIILFVVWSVAIFAPSNPSQADMLIMPPFVMFEDRTRLSDIALINSGNTPGTFKVGLIYYKQQENGSYKMLDGPLDPDHDPAKMLLFSPKQVNLPAKGRQRVRITVRKPPGLPDGEYRVHMQLQRTELVSQSDGIEEGSVSAGLDVRVGFAVPIVIRQGAQNVSIEITDPQFIDPKPGSGDQRPRLQVYLNRSGTHGTIGRLRAYWTPPGGTETQIGTLNNVNVYSELDRRVSQIVLKEGTHIAGGTMRIVYEGDGPDQGKVFDELVVPVGQ